MPHRQLDRLMWAQAYEAMERAQRLHRQFFHRAHTAPAGKLRWTFLRLRMRSQS